MTRLILFLALFAALALAISAAVALVRSLGRVPITTEAPMPAAFRMTAYVVLLLLLLGLAGGWIGGA